MNFGLSESQYDYFYKNLVMPLKNGGADIFIFGSRATGEYRKYSDVDVLIKPKSPALEKCVAEIKEQFENENFPFKIDVVFDDDLVSSYRKSVDHQKVLI